MCGTNVNEYLWQFKLTQDVMSMSSDGLTKGQQLPSKDVALWCHAKLLHSTFMGVER